MEASFIDFAEQSIGTCDFSFAIPKFLNGQNQHCAETSVLALVDDDAYDSIVVYDDNSLTSSTSCRSVKFKEDVQCHTVTRYIDQENRGDLFYSSTDVARFKQEFKIERMHSSKSYWRGKSVSLKKVLAASKPLTNMQSTSSNGDSASLNRPPFQINVGGMIV
mmetsp:Transcript_21018/g.34460  ORF Transcript_21018/g.34460 Transcript_21018/m.34460 type:complete len:163 (+) Transcript_21018:226-714(+)